MAALLQAVAARSQAPTQAPQPAVPAASQPSAPAQSGPAQSSAAQSAPAQSAPAQSGPAAKPPGAKAGATRPARTSSNGDRRRAAKLYLDSTRLFEKERFEEAMHGYEKAASLDPSNSDYTLAAEVARGHAVTALIQDAAKARMRADVAGARAALSHALDLDPKNDQVAQHLRELGNDETRGMVKPLYSPAADDLAGPLQIAPPAGTHSFHIRSSQRQVIQQVFKGFGLEATVDDSVRSTQVRFDVDDATFPQAMRALSMLTTSFYVPLDPHRVLVARDTAENRQKFVPQELETVYLSGITAEELTEMANMARNVFEVTQVNADQSALKLTIRAPHSTLAALNETLSELIEGRDQVLLEVRLIQIAHTSERNTGTQLPQTLTAFNVYAEEQQILNANSSLVQQIISSGLAAPGDTEAIIAILIASGQVTSSIFSQGIALFGGGLTLSGFSPPPVSANFNLNSSDSRELDQIQLRLGDGEAGTIRTGEKYPIETSSYSSVGTGGINIPGLTTPGSSTGLAGLASELEGSTAPPIPQVQYQDLGFTLKATPKVLRNGSVALTLDLKIDALGGTALNGIPILDNRAYTGVVTLRSGEGVAVVSELDKQQSLAISGVPGLSEIPGLNDLTSKDTQKSYSTLLVVMTPHLVRGTQAAGHSPMMRVEAGSRPRS
jgi:general secretion pathway protein D